MVLNISFFCWEFGQSLTLRIKDRLTWLDFISSLHHLPGPLSVCTPQSTCLHPWQTCFWALVAPWPDHQDWSYKIWHLQRESRICIQPINNRKKIKWLSMDTQTAHEHVHRNYIYIWTVVKTVTTHRWTIKKWIKCSCSRLTNMNTIHKIKRVNNVI